MFLLPNELSSLPEQTAAVLKTNLHGAQQVSQPAGSQSVSKAISKSSASVRQ